MDTLAGNFKRKMSELLVNEAQRRLHQLSTTNAGFDDSDPLDNCWAFLSLPQSKIGVVIGAGGRTFKLLQQMTGVSLKLVNSNVLHLRAVSMEQLEIAKMCVEGIASRSISFKFLYEALDKYVDNDTFYHVRCGTPLSGCYFISARSKENLHDFFTWCPNCKRPFDISVCRDRFMDVSVPFGDMLPNYSTTYITRTANNTRFAYVSVIWGIDPGFVLGALVLGHSLKQKSLAQYDRVLLHSADVLGPALGYLQEVWKLKPVDYLEAPDRCCLDDKGSRFDGTFTKLHAVDMCEYEKVLMLDLDIVILENLDHLFDLTAPAAMKRGANDKHHGSKLDGRRFFSGDLHASSDSSIDLSERDRWASWAWSQATGINAGVVLLPTSKFLYNDLIRCARQDLHPSHIPCAGPEQDFLSRQLAPWWTHIDVAYNYQLHHIMLNLESVLDWWATDPNPDLLPARLKLGLREISVIHFSGSLKIWDREHDSNGTPIDPSPEHFVERLYKRNNWASYPRWMARTAAADDYAAYNVALHVDDDNTKTFRSIDSDGVGTVDVQDLIDDAVSKAKAACLEAVTTWWTYLTEFINGCTAPPSSLYALLEELGRATVPSQSEFWCGQHVEVYYESDQKWYPAVVIKVSCDLRVDVRLVCDEWWDIELISLPPCVLRATSCTVSADSHCAVGVPSGWANCS